MRISLLGRNKLGLVNGSYSKDKFPECMRSHWEMVNAIDLSWLMSFVSMSLLGVIMYASDAQSMWLYLHERFTKLMVQESLIFIRKPLLIKVQVQFYCIPLSSRIFGRRLRHLFLLLIVNVRREKSLLIIFRS